MTFALLLSLIAFGVVMVITAILALNTARNSKPFQLRNYRYATYVVQNAEILEPNLISKLFNHPGFEDFKVAFEIIYKGQTKALVLYVPNEIKSFFQQLKLLEIEDYTTTFTDQNPPQFIAWSLNQNVNTVDVGQTPILTNLGLQPEEQVYWQISHLPDDSQKHPRINLILGVKGATPERTNELTRLIVEKLTKSINITPKNDAKQTDLRLIYEQRGGEWGSAINILPNQLANLILI